MSQNVYFHKIYLNIFNILLHAIQYFICLNLYQNKNIKLDRFCNKISSMLNLKWKTHWLCHWRSMLGDFCQHHIHMSLSQPYGPWQHGDNHVNYVLGMWFYAVQLSTTFISSRNLVYLLQCSAVDIETHSFTIQTVPASLPAVGQYYPMLTHFWLFFHWSWKG